jgi:hypothetical protein
LWLLCAALPLRAAEPAPAASPSERAVKAAFIYKFLSYAEWPEAAMATPDAPFVIGVIGADAIVPELVRITSGRTVGNRTIQVRPLKDGDPLDGIHLMYVGAAEPAALRRLLKEAQQHAILTVTDAEGGLTAGSVINFRIVDSRVRFEVAFDTAEKSKLKLSSRLIPVAYYIQKAAP